MTRVDEPRQPLDTAAAIADPVERARTLTQIVSEYEALVREAARMRRLAITDAVTSGMSQEQLAKALGVTAGRVSQMRKAAADKTAGEAAPLAEPVVTGWLAAEHSEPIARLAICGSRARGTNDEAISAVIPALAGLLMHQPYAVSHGPVGIGAEVLTYIADQHQPAGLDTVRGVVGHANVVRDAEYVLVIGGGSGTQAEIDAALADARRLLPMPVSGGAAARAYMRMIEDAPLRAWLPDDRFAALATADAARFAELAEAVIAREG